jgi:hypothetical protein
MKGERVQFESEVRDNQEVHRVWGFRVFSGDEKRK